MMPFHRFAAWLLAWIIASLPLVSLGQPLQPPGKSIPAQVFQQWQSALEVAGWKQGSYLNALALERSSYLLQHATNPVNWVAWSEASLAQAAAKGSLIFLSIGYSTCHWCHVMNRESFKDPDMARLINENFTAVKVDREEMPAVDQYYSGVLAMVKGSAGWPLTAILDSAGRPIFIESYLAPEALKSLLNRVVRLSAEQPALLEQSVRFLASATATTLQRGSAEQSPPLSKTELQAVAASVLGKMDPQHGGLAGVQKFPNEAALAFLSAMRQRHLDDGLAEAIDLQLGKMATGGLYDHVNGGFFRYATDSTWTVPHYEKMLYNQGLLLQAYSEAYAATKLPLYRWLISDLVDFLERWMRAAQVNGYFSAISADIGEEEGVYYLWSPTVLQQLPQKSLEAAAVSAYPGPGGAGLQGLLVGRPESAAAAQVRGLLREIAGDREKPFVDSKIITAWNGALLSGLVAARQSLGSDFEGLSVEALEANAEDIWTALYSPEAGVLYRVLYRDERQVLGVLADYAYLAKALVDLYDLSGNRQWLERSAELGRLILTHFQTAGEFTLLDNRQSNAGIPGTGAVEDGEMPAADAVALQVLWRIALRLPDERMKRELSTLVGPLREKFRRRPHANLYAGSILAEIDLGSVAPLQYFAGGNGRMVVSASTVDSACSKSPVIDIKLAPGWHVNSHKPFQEYLKPTRVTVTGGMGIASISYPEGQVVTLSFDDEPLSVYEGEFRIGAGVSRETDCQPWVSGAGLTVDLQACTDQICLPPETLRVLFPR